VIAARIATLVHTYSTFPRDGVAGWFDAFLDLTALGRQEECEEPKGRAAEVVIRYRTSPSEPSSSGPRHRWQTGRP
jgi:hypothetical protein